jgi:methyl-accepting chemotaxis protein
MRIDSVYIKEFKNLREFYVELDENQLTHVFIGKNGYGFMIDKTGTIVAHKDNAKVESFVNYVTLAKSNSSYKAMGNFISHMMSSKKGTYEINFEGSEKHIYYVPVSNTDGWILAMVADQKEMMASFYQSIMVLLTIVFK